MAAALASRLVLHAPLASFVAAACVLAGCQHRQRPIAVVPTLPASATPPADPASWNAIIRPADAQRIARIDNAWSIALREALPQHAAAIREEGALLDPAGALPRPTPPPGRYRCRVVAMGSGDRHGRSSFHQFKPFTCFVVVDGALLVFMKATGTQLPGGRLWEDGDKRMVFLGAMAPRPLASAPGYGIDARLDRAAVVERIGDFRWRMITPWTERGPTIEVMELVPATPPTPLPEAAAPK